MKTLLSFVALLGGLCFSFLFWGGLADLLAVMLLDHNSIFSTESATMGKLMDYASMPTVIHTMWYSMWISDGKLKFEGFIHEFKSTVTVASLGWLVVLLGKARDVWDDFTDVVGWS